MLICLASEEPSSELKPTAPNITFESDLFIPLHIIFVSINPDAPTNAPAIINPLFIKTKPVAEAAIPE